MKKVGTIALAVLLLSAGTASATLLGAGVTPGTGGEKWFASLSATAQQNWINTMVADHVRWLRIDSPGNLGGWYDTEIKDAKAAGINVDLTIQTWGLSPVTSSTMGPMCARQEARYHPLGIETYEVMNEPNIHGYSASTYAGLLTACYDAIKAADPGANVVFGGLANAPNYDSTGAYLGRAVATYLNAAYDAGAGGHFTQFNMHPYDFDSRMDQSPLSPANCPGNAWNPWVVCPYSLTDGQQDEIAAARQVMNAHGDSTKAIWLTEFGCPTGTDGGYPADCTDSSLATQIAGAFQQANANPNGAYGPVTNLFVYDFIDQPGYDDFGLYYASGQPKPQSLNAFVQNAP